MCAPAGAKSRQSLERRSQMQAHSLVLEACQAGGRGSSSDERIRGSSFWGTFRRGHIGVSMSLYLVAWILETELTRMAAEFVSRDTDTLKNPQQRKQAAGGFGG